MMGLQTLSVVLVTLCVLTSALQAAITKASSGSATVEQLLAEVQAAVADDRALANMFNISNSDQLSERELTALLQDILNVTSSSSFSDASDRMSSDSNADTSASRPELPVSGVATHVLSAVVAVFAALAALSATL